MTAYREAAEAERAAVVAWLRQGWGGAWELIRRHHPEIGAVHVPRVVADAIERGAHLTDASGETA